MGSETAGERPLTRFKDPSRRIGVDSVACLDATRRLSVRPSTLKKIIENIENIENMETYPSIGRESVRSGRPQHPNPSATGVSISKRT